jgi:hypothetical protein
MRALPVLALEMLGCAKHRSEFGLVCETTVRRIRIPSLQTARDFLMSIERRTHPRTNLHVPVFLFPAGATTPVRTSTENVSSDAFFCCCEYPFSPGEHVKFLLLLPDAQKSPKADWGMYIGGGAEVIRVSVTPVPGSWGVAFRIRSYRVLPDSGLLTLDGALAAMAEGDCP